MVAQAQALRSERSHQRSRRAGGSRRPRLLCPHPAGIRRPATPASPRVAGTPAPPASDVDEDQDQDQEVTTTINTRCNNRRATIASSHSHSSVGHGYSYAYSSNGDSYAVISGKDKDHVSFS